MDKRQILENIIAGLEQLERPGNAMRKAVSELQKGENPLNTSLESDKPVSGFDIAQQAGLPDDAILSKTAIATAADLLDPIDALLAGSPLLAKKGAQVAKKAIKAKVNPLDLQRSKGNEFLSAIKAQEAANPNIKPFTSDYSADELDAFKTFLTPDRKSGVAVKPDGDIINVFSGVKGRGSNLMERAIDEGGKKLDHFDQPQLNKLYGEKGFKETERLKFDDQYAPKDWNYEKLGRPDVIMRNREEPKKFEQLKRFLKRKLS